MALWKQKEDWTYEYFDLDEDVSTFIGAESFVELWNTKRGNRRVPRWSDYDWDDLFPWWGSLVVSDVFWEPYDYRYRLYGTNVVNKIGICSVPLSRHSYKGWRASSMRKFSRFNQLIKLQPWSPLRVTTWLENRNGAAISFRIF